jgi:hypothetical protein|eukprot:COSAG01_NODE_1074_length_11857_cov_21.092703_1_plen_69_part_00
MYVQLTRTVLTASPPEEGTFYSSAAAKNSVRGLRITAGTLFQGLPRGPSSRDKPCMLVDRSRSNTYCS